MITVAPPWSVTARVGAVGAAETTIPAASAARRVAPLLSCIVTVGVLDPGELGEQVTVAELEEKQPAGSPDHEKLTPPEPPE